MNAVIAQRIGRLTPLTEAVAFLDRIAPLAPRALSLSDARGCILAADIVAPAPLPAAALALRDGWAVEADATRDAGPYAPMLLNPPPQRVDAFAPLPSGTDAVAPLDAVEVADGMARIVAPAAPEDGVLPRGRDAEAGALLRPAGARLRDIDLALLAAAGVTDVQVRVPHIRLVNTRPGDPVLTAAAGLLARIAGAIVDRSDDLDDALRDETADAVIGIGGTGSGRSDQAVAALARAGTLACHGIGLSPGETAALGLVGARPVLLIPGRLDAVLACWLVLGRRMIGRLCAGPFEEPAIPARLSRKIASAVGMAEFVPVRRSGGEAEPLGASYLSMQALARADGWILVPADSEGYPAGTEIQVRPLP